MPGVGVDVGLATRAVSGAAPLGAWHTLLYLPVPTAGGSFSGDAIRVKALAAGLTPLAAACSKIRLTFSNPAGAGGAATFSKVYIGVASTDTFTGPNDVAVAALSQLLFGGLPGITLAPGASLTSDALTFATNGTAPLVVSMFESSFYFMGTANPASNFGMSYNISDHTADLGATTGWNAASTSWGAVSKIEGFV